jgi:hypothetical protein
VIFSFERAKAFICEFKERISALSSSIALFFSFSAFDIIGELVDRQP